MPHVTPESVRKLYEEGLANAAIAERLGCSREQVAQRLREMGLKNRHRRDELPISEIVAAHEGGEAIESLAKRFDCSTMTIANRLRQAGVTIQNRRSRSDVNTGKLLRMWRAGKNTREIAEATGCDPQLVRWRLRKAGVVLQPPRPEGWKPTPRKPAPPPLRRKILTERQLESARQHAYGPLVLGDTFIVCLECGKSFRALGSHLLRKHYVSVEDYKEIWGYNRSQPLMSRELVDQFEEQTRQLIADGRIPTTVLCNPEQRGRTPKGLDRRQQALPEHMAKLKAMARQGEEHPSCRADVTLDQILELLDSGMNSVQISEALGCSKSLVLRRLGGAGIRIEKGRWDVSAEDILDMYENGLSQLQIAHILGCSRKVVTNRLDEMGVEPPPGKQRRRQPTYPDVTPAAVLAARASGMTWRQMTVHFRCSEAVIRQRLHEAGAVLQRNTDARRPDVTAADVARERASGKTLRQVAEEYDCGLHLIEERLKQAGAPRENLRARRDVTRAAVVKAWRKGHSTAEIAAAFDCSITLIQRRLKDAGIRLS